MLNEIIKTEDPNIVIERVTTESTINLENLKNNKEGLTTIVVELSAKKIALEALNNLPELAMDVVKKEIGKIAGELFTCNEELKKINNILRA
jgi:hypothetical protein